VRLGRGIEGRHVEHDAVRARRADRAGDAALDALERGDEDVHPGNMAAGIVQGLAADPKAAEREFARMLPS